jgi:hypothetical protein
MRPPPPRVQTTAIATDEPHTASAKGNASSAPGISAPKRSIAIEGRWQFAKLTGTRWHHLPLEARHRSRRRPVPQARRRSPGLASALQTNEEARAVRAGCCSDILVVCSERRVAFFAWGRTYGQPRGRLPDTAAARLGPAESTIFRSPFPRREGKDIGSVGRGCRGTIPIARLQGLA